MDASFEGLIRKTNKSIKVRIRTLMREIMTLINAKKLVKTIICCLVFMLSDLFVTDI